MNENEHLTDTEHGGTGRYRALASPRRRLILDVLLAHDEPLDVQTLAEQLDLHVNTVRAHLGILEEAGLVRTRREERGRPGRPRQLYEPVTADEPASERPYRFLSHILTGALERVAPEPSQAAQEAGGEWGRYLVERPAPSERLDRDEALERVVVLLDEIGFAPELERDGEGRRILLHRCPFLEVARGHEDVICSVHLGLMRGALKELRADVAVESLLPFVSPSLCVAEFQAEPA